MACNKMTHPYWRWLACASLSGALTAQVPTVVNPSSDEDAERQQISKLIVEANHSPLDIIAGLEKHLRAHADTALRSEIEQLLAKESVEAKDNRRTILYGVPTLAKTPNDAQLLDRVTFSLLTVGGKENAQKALEFARKFEDYIVHVPVPTGADAVRNQEDHDRALERALLFQSRAFTLLGAAGDARIKAELAFRAFPEASSAREWAEALDRDGHHEDAVKQMAAAFAIPDSAATQEDRALDRRALGEMYRKLHNGSDAGLGDVVLEAYDRTNAILEKRHKELIALDPNYGITDPSKFVLDGLDGNRLPLASLKGKVLILDFWATWCGPCRAQHPLYEQVRKRFEDRDDVLFLSIDADDERNLVSPFLETQQWSRAVYFETGLGRLLQVANIPTTIILDKDGQLARRMNGFLPDRFVDQLTEHIRDILAGPVSTQASGGQVSGGPTQ
ncbi:MAG TPA: TlpA disulfide reductase family protein [Bryobacteraceae bacterium]|nr:TlpA disulfide reductase family protein [Bryobacteraceae bacterium]